MRLRTSVSTAAMAPSPLATYVIALDGSSWDVNPRLEELLGYPEGTLTAEIASPDQLIHPDDLERVRAEVAAAQESADHHRMEYRLRHADGQYVWVLDEAMFEAGTRSGFLLDVTERVRVVEELRLSEERFRTLLLNIPGAMYR